MSTTAIKQRILNVLIKHKDRKYITISEIARLAYGDAYIRDTRKHLDQLIRRNIYSAMELAMQNDMIVLTVKNRNPITKEIEKKILGYKIAGKEDYDIIQTMLEDKEKRANAYIIAYNTTQSELRRRNLLPDVQMKMNLLTSDVHQISN
jgi:hypothetical protein